MVLFARSQPDTPAKLTAHAYSYEHMELAAYELLRRAASVARDAETEAVAAEIAAEEQRMAERLAGCFDAAVEAALRELDRDDLGEQVDGYLSDVHALEHQALSLLQAGPALVDDDGLARLFREHLEESRGQLRRVEERLEARGAEASRLKDLALRAGGLNVGGFFGAQPDTTAKLAGFAFAFEHVEIGAYEILQRVAERAGDAETAQAAEATLVEERAAAERIAATWDRVMPREMRQRTGAA
jgi:ferritin-like metal-binding protein YciE